MDTANLAEQYPEKNVKEMEKAWEAWRDTVNLPKGWRDLKTFAK